MPIDGEVEGASDLGAVGGVLGPNLGERRLVGEIGLESLAPEVAAGRTDRFALGVEERRSWHVGELGR
ncbi:hypothetical protein D3C83_144710 [compost metagenome]